MIAMRAKLGDIIEELECQSLESAAYLDKKTGQVVLAGEEELRAAEDNQPLEDYPDWQRDAIKVAGDIIENEENYIPLPTKFDINDYDIMESYCLSLQDKKMREHFYNAIKAKGAFGRFKELIHRFEIADEWYKFRQGALKKIAIEWCQHHGIEYISD